MNVVERGWDNLKLGLRVKDVDDDQTGHISGLIDGARRDLEEGSLVSDPVVQAALANLVGKQVLVDWDGPRSAEHPQWSRFPFTSKSAVVGVAADLELI